MIYSSTFFDGIVEESLSSAMVVVPYVIDLICPRSVVDVGCGTGAWLSVFRSRDINTTIGLDGVYVDQCKLHIPLNCFRAVDLTKPFCFFPERFDLAMSLEVAEHLPPESAFGFVESLCQLAPIVLFSAAVPGQGGVHHVNEQWPEYWRQLFADHNFRMLDPFRPLLWQDNRVASYYRQNLFLFVRNDLLQSKPELSRLPEVTDGSGLILVEAHILFGLRATIKRLPHALWTTVQRRVRDLLPKPMEPKEASPQGHRISK